jgi:hypothetical protein
MTSRPRLEHVSDAATTAYDFADHLLYHADVKW